MREMNLGILSNRNEAAIPLHKIFVLKDFRIYYSNQIKTGIGISFFKKVDEKLPFKFELTLLKATLMFYFS